MAFNKAVCIGSRYENFKAEGEVNLDDRFHIATVQSILIGFALVFWELQQNRAMTEEVLASDGAISRAELELQIASFSAVYVAACQDSAALTMEERFVLTQIYRAFFDSHVNRLLNYKRDLDTGVTWKSNARAFFRFMFETDFGRAHWRRIRGGFDNELPDLGDDILKASGSPSCYAKYGLDDGA